MVIQEAEKKYSISSNELLRGGYTVKVPMSTKVQEAAYELMKENRYFPGTDNSAQGAFVLVDNKSGGVLSVMGGRDYVQKSLNRVNVKRQPGSTMKPIAVYGPALEEGQFKPYSLLQDKLRSYGGYTPKNVDGQYAKKVTMYDALKDSKNAAAVWTLNQLGVETSKQ